MTFTCISTQLVYPFQAFFTHTGYLKNALTLRRRWLHHRFEQNLYSILLLRRWYQYCCLFCRCQGCENRRIEFCTRPSFYLFLLSSILSFFFIPALVLVCVSPCCVPFVLFWLFNCCALSTSEEVLACVCTGLCCFLVL